ncbi:tyrosine--tRNA ligase 1, cytoplasmic-like protein [Tanacetum coccineum]
MVLIGGEAVVLIGGEAMVIEGRYGYCKNLKKTVKTGQTRTRERKENTRAGRMLSKVNKNMLLGLLPGQENMSTSDSYLLSLWMMRRKPMPGIHKIHCIPWFNEFKVERKKENGGAKVFAKYEQLVADYAKGDLHPADLKHALTTALKKILQYVHDHFKNDEKTKALLKKVKVQDPITLTTCIILERRQQIQQNTFADQRRTRMNAKPFKETQQSSEHINISSQCRTRINAHHPNRPLHSFDHRKRIFCAA